MVDNRYETHPGGGMPGKPETPHPLDLGLKSTERLFIERTLIRMYPRLQRHDLFPWNLFNGPLIPDFLIRNTNPRLRRILVIGCEDGVFCNVLSLLFPDIEIVGIDTDAAKIAKAKATVGYRQNLKFICGNPVVMADIPCDRIIYNRCLSRQGSAFGFKKLLIKTLSWLVNEGDFIVRETPLSLINNLTLMKELYPKLRASRSLEGSIRGVLGEVGYPNPMIFSHGKIPGLSTDIFYRSPKMLTLTSMLAKPIRKATGEWQDLGDQSTDSVVGFLFADQVTDFTREFV
jgi:hypothetical protein